MDISCCDGHPLDGAINDPFPQAALVTYAVFIIWRVSVFVVLYHHAREQARGCS